MAATTVNRFGTYRKRRTGAVRAGAGFSTKPAPNVPADGIKRIRLIDGVTGKETRVKVSQFWKTYEPA